MTTTILAVDRHKSADLRLTLADLREISAALSTSGRYSPVQRYVDAAIESAAGIPVPS